MEQNNSQTNDGNSLEERFELLSRQNQQQNERFEKLSQNMDQRFIVMMQALENLSQDKRKYREREHAAAQTCRKRVRKSVECPQARARTSTESPEDQQESSHQVSDDNFIENSSSAPKIPHSEQETEIIKTKIKKLLAKEVIIECERDKGGFISTIFTNERKMVPSEPY